MASDAGKVYVRLVLDDETYKQKLSEDIKNTEATVQNIAKIWNFLGSKTDEYYNNQIKGAKNALTYIQHAHESTYNDILRAQSAMTAKINAMNQEMVNPMKQMWETLGIKSQASIQAQKSAIISSFDEIKKSGTATQQDLINLEKAKNEKLKALNKEMVGDHDMSMAAMTRAVLRFYAAWYVASTAAMAVGNFFKGGVETIDKMNLSAISVAAVITNLQGSTGNIAENYKNNLAYAQALIPVLMQIDAASTANLEQVILINKALQMHGVFLDANNKKQIDTVTDLTNMINIITEGQNKEQQATQETNAALNGEVNARNRLALMLDQQIKRQGDYKNGLKGLNEEAKKHNDWLERIAPYLVGIRAAAGDITKTWEATGSSIKTVWMLMQQEMFADFYKGLVESGQNAVGWFRENIPEIGKYFRIAMNMVGDIIGGVWNVLKGFAPIFIDLAKLTAPIAYGWGGVFAAMKPIGTFLGNAIKLTYDLIKMIGSAGGAAIALGKGDFESAQMYWGETKKYYGDIKKLSVENYKVVTTGIADSIIAYDKQYKAAQKANKGWTLPKLGGGKGEGGDESDKLANKVDKLAKKLAEEWDKMAAKLNAKIENEGLNELKKDLIANQIEADELIEKFGKIAGAIDLIKKAQLIDDNAAIAKAEEKALNAAEKRINEQMQIDKKAYDEAEKIKNDRIAFYEEIEGYEEKAYQLKLSRIEEERMLNMAMYGDIGAANAKANQDQIKALTTKIDAEQEWAKTTINNFGAILDAAKECYDEDSSEYKKLNNMKKGVLIAQQAMEIAKNIKILAGIGAQTAATVAAAATENAANSSKAVTGAVAAVATQGSGDPYTAFARIAAMLAIMTGVLSIAGIAFSAGSSSSAVASGPSYTGKSTVLGAADDVLSESISKSYELLQDTYEMEYSELSQLNQSMTELNGNITGLVSSIVRTGSFNSNGFNISTGTKEAWIKEKGWWVIQPLSGQQFGDNGFGKSTISKIRMMGLDFPSLLIEHLVGEAIGKIFGGKTSTEIQETGIAAGISGNISNILGGAYNINPYEYAITKTSKDGGWFGSDSESYSAYTQAASEQVTSLFRKVFINMSSSLVELAKTFGTDVNDVMNYAFESFQINLRGMSGEEINEALSAKFSEMMDIATEELFGNVLYQYQQVGEALYETAVRLATDKAIVSELIRMTGQQLPKTSLAIIELSESLINLAGDLETLQDSFASYYDKFTSAEEKQANIKTDISEILNSMGYALPSSREGYKALVEQVGLLDTEEGQRKFVALLKISGSVDEYFSYLEDAAKKAADAAKELYDTKRSMDIQILELEGKIAEATAMKRADELAAMDESLRATQERIWALQDEAAAADAAKEAADKAKAAHEEALSTAQNNLKDAFSAEKELRQSAHEHQIELLNQQKEAAAEAVSSLQEIYDRLKSARESMSLGDTKSQQSTYLSALSILASGNTTKLTDDVLSTLTSSDNIKFYSSEQDYKRSYYQIYNSLFTLEQRAGIQLTAAEKTVELLESQITITDKQFDDQMSAMDRQLDALLEVNKSVLSIAQAIAALEDVTGKKYNVTTTATASISSTSIADTSLSALYRSRGLTELANIMAIAGDNPTAEEYAAARKQVRGYADGGYHSGGLRVVGENGPELEFTGPSRIYSNLDSKKLIDNSEVIAELKALREEVANLRAEAKKGTRYLQNLDEWNEIGMPVTQAA